MTPNDIDDCYKTLGVSKSASPDEVKAAYTRLINFHPPRDRAGPAIVERIDKIEAAYLAVASQWLTDGSGPEPSPRRPSIPLTPPSNAGSARKPPAPANGNKPAASVQAPPTALPLTPAVASSISPAITPSFFPDTNQPISCSKCGVQSPLLRYYKFGEVKSFIILTWNKPKVGIFCTKCAEHQAHASTAITAIFGWWGIPWGFIFPPIAIIGNAFGGQLPPDENYRILIYQARAFAVKGDFWNSHEALAGATAFADGLTGHSRVDALRDVFEIEAAIPAQGKHVSPKRPGNWSGAFFVQAAIVGVVFLGFLLIGSQISSAPSAKQPVAPTSASYTVASPALNCRKDHNPKSEVIDTFGQNTQLTAIGDDNGWVKVHDDKGDCWVNASLLTKATPAVTTSPGDGTTQSSAQTEGAASNNSAETRVPMVLDGGVFRVPIKINNKVELNFILDSGAAEVQITQDVFMTLVRSGTITENDMTGSKSYTIADGSTVTEPTFTIRSLKVGDWEGTNVSASVAPTSGDLLLGQSFLKGFHSWSIDNAKHELVLK